jgi:D-hexose-6-phosphate mutarotase
MKNNLLVLVLLSLTYPTFGKFYPEDMTHIASQEGYPKFMIGLRNKAEDFLTRVKISMLVQIDDLREQGLDYRADELLQQYTETYFKLENDIDLVFEKINREFLRKAANLNRKNASVKEKTALIAKAKEKAQQIVDKELQKNERLIKNNKQNIDK